MDPRLKACKVPLSGISMLIDGFALKSPEFAFYGLTHYHSDHYGGLNKNWKYGPIFATPITIALAVQDIGILQNHFRPLQLNKPVEIDGTGVYITALDANHCPGACMFLIRQGKRRVLFTGDFRYHPADMDRESADAIAGLAGDIETIFLDTTYLSPRWEFPAQRAVLDALTTRALELNRPDRLFVVATYKIGKEKVLFALADALHTRVNVSEAKLALLSVMYPPAIVAKYFTATDVTAQVHVAKGVSFKGMPGLLEHAVQAGFTSVVGVVATGWTHTNPRNGTGTLVKTATHPDCSGQAMLLTLAYSEHSSFSEARALVRVLGPKRVQSIVSTAPEEAKKIKAHLKDCMDLSTDRSTLIPFLSQTPQPQKRKSLEVIDLDPSQPQARSEFIPRRPRLEDEAALPEIGMPVLVESPVEVIELD